MTRGGSRARADDDDDCDCDCDGSDQDCWESLAWDDDEADEDAPAAAGFAPGCECDGTGETRNERMSEDASLDGSGARPSA
jgi:hypothetical protein